MDFGLSQLSGLLNNITHERTRYLPLLYKLKALVELHRNKKLINTGVDKLLITSSPRDIYKNINYQHPMVLILAEYVGRMDWSADGAVYFTKLVSRLIDSLLFLLENGVGPREISCTFWDVSKSIRCDSAPLTLAEHVSVGNVSPETKSFIRKLVGNERITDLLVESVETTKSFDSERIRVQKVVGGTLDESYRIDGIVLNRGPEGTVKSLRSTSVALFNCPFDITRTELKGTLLFKTHQDLLNYGKEEVERAREIVDSINVNVMVILGNINEMFLEFANRRNILVLRVFNKFDLKRICDAVGGAIYSSIGPVRSPGFASEVSLFKESGTEMTRIVGSSAVSTIVLRHTLRPVLDGCEQTILSTLASLKKTRIFEYTTDQFHDVLASKIGGDTAVHAQIRQSLHDVKPFRLLVDDGYRCARYAFEFISTIMEIDDYLVARRDALDVKPPNQAGHWDDTD